MYIKINIIKIVHLTEHHKSIFIVEIINKCYNSKDDMTMRCESVQFGKHSIII